MPVFEFEYKNFSGKIIWAILLEITIAQFNRECIAPFTRTLPIFFNCHCSARKYFA